MAGTTRLELATSAVTGALAVRRKRHKYVTRIEQAASYTRTFVTQQHLGKRHK